MSTDVTCTQCHHPANMHGPRGCTVTWAMVRGQRAELESECPCMRKTALEPRAMAICGSCPHALAVHHSDGCHAPLCPCTASVRFPQQPPEQEKRPLSTADTVLMYANLISELVAHCPIMDTPTELLDRGTAAARELERLARLLRDMEGARA